MRTVVVPVGAIAIASLMGIVAALVAVAIPARVASQASPLAAQRASDLVTAPSASRLGIALLAASLVSTQVPWSGLFAIAASSVTMAAFAVGTALLSRALLRVALRVTSPVLDRVFGMSGKLARAFTERNANRNGVAIGTVVVGTGLVIGVGSMVAGVNERISTWIDGTIVGDVFVSAPVSFPVTFEEDARSLAAIDNVSGVGIRAVRYLPGGEARARSIALVLANPERFHPDLGFGAFQYVDGQGDPTTGYEVLRDPDRVLISSTLQERFDLEVGDTLSLRTSDGFAEFGIGGVVIDFTGGGETVLTTIHDLDRFGGGMPDMYVMTASEGSDALEAAAALRTAFPELYLDATTASAYRDEIRAFSERTFATTNLLLILAVVVSALGVTNTLGMNLTNRQRDLATLRVLGLARRDLRKIVLAEGLVVVVVGSVLGLVLGLLLADSMTTGAAALTGYRVDAVVPWPIVGLAIVVSPLLGLLASFAPARSASNLPPVAALRKAS